MDLRSLNRQHFLCTEAGLLQAVDRVKSYPTCPTARDLVKTRRKRLERARQIVDAPRGSVAATQLTSGQATRFAAGGASRNGRGGEKIIGVIPVWGPLDQHITSELIKAGGTACDEVAAMLDACIFDSSITGIILHFDSPGGYSYGIQELSDKVYAARNKKPITAIADSMACSAAFWVATAASELYVTPGGDIGSVGVYCLHVSEAEALKKAGLEVTVIATTAEKVERSPFAPLSDAARANMQKLVDADMSRFVRALARNRSTSPAAVLENFGQGRTVSAVEAVTRRMADGVAPFETLLRGRLGIPVGRIGSTDMQAMRAAHAARQRGLDRLTADLGRGSSSASRGPSVEVLRLRQEQRRRRIAALTRASN